jgi:hypothetical protein
MNNHEGHIKLWDELARTGSNNKHTTFNQLFPELVGQGGGYGSSCFACVEDDDRCTSDDDCGCEYCPITDDGNTCADGFFSEWCRAKTKDERKRLAAIIRDLPWKEKT